MIRTALAVLAVTALLLISMVFAFLNKGSISLDFAVASFEIQKSVALVGALVVGFVLGVVSAAFSMLRLMSQRRSLHRSLKLAEQEVQALRSLPIQDAD